MSSASRAWRSGRLACGSHACAALRPLLDGPPACLFSVGGALVRVPADAGCAVGRVVRLGAACLGGCGQGRLHAYLRLCVPGGLEHSAEPTGCPCARTSCTAARGASLHVHALVHASRLLIHQHHVLGAVLAPDAQLKAAQAPNVACHALPAARHKPVMAAPLDQRRDARGLQARHRGQPSARGLAGGHASLHPSTHMCRRHQLATEGLEDSF